jgi:hypothetical protein
VARAVEVASLVDDAGSFGVTARAGPESLPPGDATPLSLEPLPVPARAVGETRPLPDHSLPPERLAVAGVAPPVDAESLTPARPEEDPLRAVAAAPSFPAGLPVRPLASPTALAPWPMFVGLKRFATPAPASSEAASLGRAAPPSDEGALAESPESPAPPSRRVGSSGVAEGSAPPSLTSLARAGGSIIHAPSTVPTTFARSGHRPGAGTTRSRTSAPARVRKVTRSEAPSSVSAHAYC